MGRNAQLERLVRTKAGIRRLTKLITISKAINKHKTLNVDFNTQDIIYLSYGLFEIFKRLKYEWSKVTRVDQSPGGFNASPMNSLCH